MKDTNLTAEQILIAVHANEKLRILAQTDQAAAEKIIKDYVATLDKKSGEYGTWDYVLTREAYSGREESIIQRVSEAVRIHENVTQHGPWVSLLSKNQLSKIRKAALTHCACDAREAWAIALGDGSGNVNSDEIPDGAPLSRSTGAGVQTVTMDGEVLEIYYGDKNDLCVRAEITTWKGTSLGAEHYYAKLNVYGYQPHLRVVSAPKGSRCKKGAYYCISGWGDSCKPFITRLHDITVRRPLTKSDIKETKARFNPDRYEGYTIGDYIDGFWTRESAIEHAKKQHARLFDTKCVRLEIEDSE